MYTNARYFNIGPHLNPFGHINKAHKEFYLASHEFFYSTLKDETIQNLEIFVYDPTMMKMCKNLSSSRWYKKSNRNFQQMGGPYPSTFIIEKLTFENVHCNIAHSFQGIRACKCYGQTDRKHYTITHFDRLPPVRWQKCVPMAARLQRQTTPAGILWNLYRDVGPKHCHHSQTSRAQSPLDHL